MMKRVKLLLAAGALGMWSLVSGQDAVRKYTLEEIEAIQREALVPPAPDGKLPGRFVLQPCVLDGMRDNSHELFRIDTATGKVWQLTAVRGIQFWGQVSEEVYSKLLPLSQAPQTEAPSKGKR